MTKVDNSTKGWGNVLKPQGQADTAVVIQPREMKLDELVAVLDKMSDKGSKVVECKDPTFCYELDDGWGDLSSIQEFRFDADRNRYYGHMEGSDFWLDTRVMGKDTIAGATKQMWKQQLADEIGINTEYKLPKPMPVMVTDGTKAVIESVKVTDDYGHLNFTYKGMNTYSDGDTYYEKFDPDLESEYSIEPSVIADISKNVLDTIAKEKNVVKDQDRELRDSLIDTIRKSGVIVETDRGVFNALNPKENISGFTQYNQIYLDPSKGNAAAPIGLYSFLWMDSAREKNPEKWNDIVKMVKTVSGKWNIDGRDPDDNEHARQIIARAVGNRGIERFKGKDLTSTPITGAVDTFDKVVEKILNDLAEGVHPRNIDLDAIGKSQAPAQAVDAEKTLHDNFEELMKESEKEEQSKGIKR